MKRTLFAALALATGLGSVSALSAQTATPPSPWGPLKIQHVDAKTYAQKLVNDTLAKHPDIIIMAMHVTPSGKKVNEIIASNIGRIGKPGDEDDQRVIDTGKANKEVNTAGDHFECEAPMRDKAGRIIGAVGIVYMYKPGDDKQALAKKAMAVQAEMQAQTPSRAALFAPVK